MSDGPATRTRGAGHDVNLACSDERLDNGLRLLMIEDHRIPAAAVCLWYDVGSRNEVQGRTGFAHLFEHLMFEGSRHVARGEHATTINELGGSYNATTSLDRTNYFEVVPSHCVELALWFEADRMGGLLDSVTEENLENQRAIVKNERRQRVDNVPCGTGFERILAHLFPAGHPYHHPTIGFMPDIDAAQLDDVHAFFRSYYAPNNAVLAVVGDIDAVEVRGWVEKYFGGIDANPNIVKARDGSLPLTLGGEIRETVPDQVVIPRVMVGFRAPRYGTADWDALMIACRVLVGGRGSRFETLLRRDRQITLGAGIGGGAYIGGVSMATGGFQPGPGIELEEAEAAYLAALNDLVDKPPTEDELERAAIQLEVGYLGRYQQLLSRANAICEGATYFGDPTWPQRQIDQLLAVTAEDAARVAAEVFQPHNRVLLTFVPGGDAENDETEVAA